MTRKKKIEYEKHDSTRANSILLMSRPDCGHPLMYTQPDGYSLCAFHFLKQALHIMTDILSPHKSPSAMHADWQRAKDFVRQHGIATFEDVERREKSK